MDTFIDCGLEAVTCWAAIDSPQGLEVSMQVMLAAPSLVKLLFETLCWPLSPNVQSKCNVLVAVTDLSEQKSEDVNLLTIFIRYQGQKYICLRDKMYLKNPP